MILALNQTATMHCNLLTDIRIANEVGFGGIELIHAKLYRYLETGFSVESLRPYLNRLPVVGLGFVTDIERQEPKEHEALLQECENMCGIAEQLGCPSVLLLTGPLAGGVGDDKMYEGDICNTYQGLIGMSWPEVRKLTAKNLKVLADIGKQHNVEFYLEALSWTPLHTLQQTLELLDETGKDNVSIMIDFWHHWTSGTKPEDIAKLDRKLIKGVHFCDSLPVTGNINQELRNVWTGAGVIPLQEWVDAVKATGYDGWWSCELFSFKHYELDPWETARNLKGIMEYLIMH